MEFKGLTRYRWYVTDWDIHRKFKNLKNGRVQNVLVSFISRFRYGKIGLRGPFAFETFEKMWFSLFCSFAKAIQEICVNYNKPILLFSNVKRMQAFECYIGFFFIIYAVGKGY